MTASSILEKLKSFDAYPKPLEDFRIKTFGGGVVAVICCVVVTILVLFEVNAFLTAEIEEELVVDTTQTDRLRINIDIVLHHISCSYVAVDSMDTSGEMHVNAHRNLFKRRLDLQGRPLQDPQKDQGGAKKVSNQTQIESEKCGSCYGAESADRTCCNSCSDVRSAYLAKGWGMPSPSSIKQCRDIDLNDEHLNATNEGCQVYGFLDVTRVGGNFHLSPGRSFQMGHLHVHDMQPFSPEEFNISHTIRHLSFGDNHLLGWKNPLDGLRSTVDKGGAFYKYFLKIVPTIWLKEDGTMLPSNQFSVTRFTQAADEMNSGSSPGLFFNYEFAPVMVKYSQKRKSWLHLITSVCSIVGGVVTVAGLLDSAIFNSVRALRKKVELGKQG